METNRSYGADPEFVGLQIALSYFLIFVGIY